MPTQNPKKHFPPGRASPSTERLFVEGGRGIFLHLWCAALRANRQSCAACRRIATTSPPLALFYPHHTKKGDSPFCYCFFLRSPHPCVFFTKQQQSGAQQGSKNTQSASSKQQAAVPKMRGPLCLLRDGQYARHRAFAALPPFCHAPPHVRQAWQGPPHTFCLCVCASAADLTASRPQQRTGADNNIWAQTEKRDHKTPTPRRAFFYFFLLLSLLCLPSFGLFTHHLLNLGLYCTRAQDYTARACVFWFLSVCVVVSVADAPRVRAGPLTAYILEGWF